MSPYLSFTDNAREAMDLYSSVFGGTVTRSTFGEAGLAEDPADADLVMHSQLDTEAFTLMVADTPPPMRGQGEAKDHHPVALWGDDEDTLRRWWDGLGEGGQVHVPLERAPWGDVFGQLQDRFGVTWMFNVSAPA